MQKPLVICGCSLAPNGLAARVCLAILASAGILCANFSPVIVSGLAQSSNFTGETAGYVFSDNMYGTAVGGFAIIFLINQLNWRWAAVALITLLICTDFFQPGSAGQMRCT